MSGALGGIAGRQPAELVSDDVRVAADRAGDEHRVTAAAEPQGKRGVCASSPPAKGSMIGYRSEAMIRILKLSAAVEFSVFVGSVVQPDGIKNLALWVVGR